MAYKSSLQRNRVICYGIEELIYDIYFFTAMKIIKERADKKIYNKTFAS